MFATRLFLAAIVALSTATNDGLSPHQEKAQEEARKAQNNQTAAVVTGSAAITYIKPMDRSKVEDTANCLWLATAACQIKNLDYYKQTLEYQQHFDKVMSTLGWTLGQSSDSDYNATDANATMDKVVIDILVSTIGTAGAGATVAVIQTLNALKQKAGKDGKIAIFDVKKADDGKGNFIIGYAMEDDFGYVSTCSTAFRFKTKTVDGAIPFFSAKLEKTDISYRMAKRQLNNTVWKISGQKLMNTMINKMQKVSMKLMEITSEDVAEANNGPDDVADSLLAKGKDTDVSKVKLGASMASVTAAPNNTRPKPFCLSTASDEALEELEKLNAYVEQRLGVRARARENVDKEHWFVSAHRDYEDVERPRSFMSTEEGYFAFYTPTQQKRLGVDACGYSASD